MTLASGTVSDFYVDCKQTTLHAEGAALIGARVFALVEKLREQGADIRGVGGLTLGSDPIAIATALVSSRSEHPIHAFVIRKEPKKHGTRAWLEGGQNLQDGSPVLITEDVITTGASTLKAVERALESGLKPVAVVTLVDRCEGGKEKVEEETGLSVYSLTTRDDFF